MGRVLWLNGLPCKGSCPLPPHIPDGYNYKSYKSQSIGFFIFFFIQFYYFEKKFKFLVFHGVASTREDLFIDVLITNVGLMLAKPGWYLLSGYGQTDRHGFGILMETCRHTKKFNSKLKISR